MSGFVPKRVSSTRTAMGSTDANSTGKNGHSIVSTIGRRSTLLRGIQTRSFGSMWQIDYLNAAGNKCRQEELVPTYSTESITLPVDTYFSFQGFRDGNTAGFVRKSLQKSLVSLYGGNVYTDKYCAMGNVVGNVGDRITLPNILRSSAPCFGDGPGSPPRQLIAIERWMTTGWTAFTTHPSYKNGLVIVVSGSGSGVTAANCPAIKISGVSTTETTLNPREIQYSGAGGAITTGFGGVDIGDFVVILYGGDGAAPIPDRDSDFISGWNIGESKNFQLQFVNTS